MAYSNQTPGPRFHELQARERARLRRLADKETATPRERSHARAHLAANVNRAGGVEASELALRAESFALVSAYFERGGFIGRYSASVPATSRDYPGAPSGQLVKRHQGVRWTGRRCHGYLSTPTWQAERDGYRRVCGGRS